MKKIAAIGEILWDNFPDGKMLGGAPANFAIFSRYLGNEAYIISAVGDDDLGQEMIEKLQTWKINTSLLQIQSYYKTGEVNVHVDEQGIPHYQIVENRACDHIQYTDEMKQFANQFDAICYGSLSSRSEETKQTIFNYLATLPKSCLKVCDLNIRKDYYSKQLIESLLQISNVFKINENEKILLEKELNINLDCVEHYRSFLQQYNLKVLIITSGEIDSEIVTPAEYSRKKSKKIDVIDTVGAGDSFLAAFVDGYLKEMDISENHEKSISLSAEVCRGRGATGILEELE